jgi:hypothetical protein
MMIGGGGGVDVVEKGRKHTQINEGMQSVRCKCQSSQEGKSKYKDDDERRRRTTTDGWAAAEKRRKRTDGEAKRQQTDFWEEDFL